MTERRHGPATGFRPEMHTAKEFYSTLEPRQLDDESDEEFAARCTEQEARIGSLPDGMSLDEYHEVAVVRDARGAGIEVVAFAAEIVMAGVVGNTAYELLKAYVRRCSKRIQEQADNRARLYVIEIAVLSVGTRLSEGHRVLVRDCTKHEDHWSVTTTAGRMVYRVRVPINDPSQTTVSMDLP